MIMNFDLHNLRYLHQAGRTAFMYTTYVILLCFRRRKLVVAGTVTVGALGYLGHKTAGFLAPRVLSPNESTAFSLLLDYLLPLGLINRLRAYLTTSMTPYNTRVNFRNAPLPKLKINRNQPHPVSAAMRTQADTFMSQLIRTAGHTIHCWPATDRDIAVSSSDIIHNPEQRHYARTRPGCDVVKHTDWMKIVDLETQQDLNYILRYGRPLLMLAFQPAYAAHSCAEYGYQFDEKSVATLVFQGRDSYKRPILDLTQSHVNVNTYTGSYLYTIELRETADPNWKIAMFTPISFQRFYWAGSAERIKMRNYLVTDRIVVPQGKGSVSIANPNSMSCVDIPMRVLDLCRERYRNYKGEVALQPQSLERVIISAWKECQQPAVAAIYVFNYLKQEFPLPMIVPDEHTFMPSDPLVLEEPIASMRSVGKAYVSSSFAPANGYNSDAQCVAGRITAVRNSITHYPQDFWNWMDEFVAMTVPDAITGCGVPLDQSEIEELQSRPTQRAIADQYRFELPFIKNTIRSFMKREAYPKITDPRNISTVLPKHKLLLSAYSESFTRDIMKQMKWYGFALNPAQVAEAIHDLAISSPDGLVDCDYSRYDGTLGAIHAVVCRRLMFRWVHPVYLPLLEELLNEEFNTLTGETVEARTKHGVKYDVGTTRVSGSSLTSLFNTSANAFEKYCALRRSGLSPTAAFKALGIYAGDDSLDRSLVTKENLEWVTKHTGLTIKYVLNPAGSAVPFLGRLYYDPWNRISHTIDIRRQLYKLNLTTAPSCVRVNEVLLRKAESYLVTDPNTPLIAAWARAVTRICPPSSAKRLRAWGGDAGYLVKLWSHVPDSWVQQDPVEAEEACKHQNLDPGWVEMVEDIFARASTIDELFPGLIEEIPTAPVTFPVVHAGYINYPHLGHEYYADTIYPDEVHSQILGYGLPYEAQLILSSVGDWFYTEPHLGDRPSLALPIHFIAMNEHHDAQVPESKLPETNAQSEAATNSAIPQGFQTQKQQRKSSKSKRVRAQPHEPVKSNKPRSEVSRPAPNTQRQLRIKSKPTLDKNTSTAKASPKSENKDPSTRNNPAQTTKPNINSIIGTKRLAQLRKQFGVPNATDTEVVELNRKHLLGASYVPPDPQVVAQTVLVGAMPTIHI
jgi:hypothetical protein